MVANGLCPTSGLHHTNLAMWEADSVVMPGNPTNCFERTWLKTLGRKCLRIALAWTLPVVDEVRTLFGFREEPFSLEPLPSFHLSSGLVRMHRSLLACATGQVVPRGGCPVIWTGWENLSEARLATVEIKDKKHFRLD